jgi:hypothetical protein
MNRTYSYIQKSKNTHVRLPRRKRVKSIGNRHRIVKAALNPRELRIGVVRFRFLPMNMEKQRSHSGLGNREEGLAI